MDEFTHLNNYAKPIDPELFIIVAAIHDGYVPREGYTSLDSLWPGCEIRFLDSGHVTGYILHQSMFRKSIADAVDRYRLKYNQDGTLRASTTPRVCTATMDGVAQEILGYQSKGSTSSVDSSPRL